MQALQHGAGGKAASERIEPRELIPILKLVLQIDQRFLEMCKWDHLSHDQLQQRSCTQVHRSTFHLADRHVGSHNTCTLSPSPFVSPSLDFTDAQTHLSQERIQQDQVRSIAGQHIAPLASRRSLWHPSLLQTSCSSI